MKFLIIDTSGALCSAAVTEEDKMISECCTDNGLTHSATLMGLIDGALSAASSTLGDMDAFALTVGPGSFTGLRIGLSTVKAFSQATGRPIVALDTLSLLAENFLGLYDAVCPVLDAKGGRVYTALFRQGARMSEDQVLEISQLEAQIGRNDKILFTGDGVDPYQTALEDRFRHAVFTPKCLRYQRASFGAARVLADYKNGLAQDAKSVFINYLVKPQAERNYEKNSDSHAEH